MPKTLGVVDEHGSVSFVGISKISFLLILGAFVYIAALAVNEFFQKVLEKYVKKDGLIGYFIYAVIAIFMVILLAYGGCKASPDIVEFINLSPIS